MDAISKRFATLWVAISAESRTELRRLAFKPDHPSDELVRDLKEVVERLIATLELDVPAFTWAAFENTSPSYGIDPRFREWIRDNRETDQWPDIPGKPAPAL